MTRQKTHASGLREDLEEAQRKAAETEEDNAALYKKVEKLKAMLAEERHKVMSSQSPAKVRVSHSSLARF